MHHIESVVPGATLDPFCCQVAQVQKNLQNDGRWHKMRGTYITRFSALNRAIRTHTGGNSGAQPGAKKRSRCDDEETDAPCEKRSKPEDDAKGG